MFLKLSPNLNNEEIVQDETHYLRMQFPFESVYPVWHCEQTNGEEQIWQFWTLQEAVE